MARSTSIANESMIAFVIAAVLTIVAQFSCAAVDSSDRPAPSRYSVAWVCDVHAGQVRALFAALDLERPGMGAVRDAAREERWEDACHALVSYYRACNSGSWLRLPGPPGNEPTSDFGDRILENTFTFYWREYKVPLAATGEIDWATRGPDGDEQWTVALNRHSHLPWLMRAYLATGKTVYTDRMCDQAVDWMDAYPYPGSFTANPQWSGMQVVTRIENWAEVFYGLQHSDAFPPGVRILMLAGVYDHARYLATFHRNMGNWAAVEMLGLAETAAAWPEFADSRAWLELSRRVMKGHMDTQAYPDGAQKELTGSYHLYTVKHFENFVRAAARGGVDVGADFTPGIERMWNYAANTMRPDGFNPMNNDSDHDLVRDDLAAAAGRLSRPDWEFIATNGESGARPEGVASRVCPWSGQLVMRDGWGPGAQWAFFDVGPAGTTHQHADKLHLSVSAYGRDLLVDPGRYTYTPGPDRDYFQGSAGHNVILIDGAGQNLGALVADEPLAPDSYATDADLDVARASTDSGFVRIEGTATHTRAVVYVRGRFWVVVDRIDTDRPRDLTVLWHYHPECTVVMERATAVSVDDDAGNLRIVPASRIDWRADAVTGQTAPALQGWYSVRYGERAPSPTAIFSARVDGSGDEPVTFAWVLVPARGAVPAVSARLETDADDTAVVTVDGLDAGNGERRVRVRVPMRSGRPGVAPAFTE